MEKHAFLKYLKKHKLQKHLEEDAVMSIDATASSLNSSDGIASANNAASSLSKLGDVVQPSIIAGLTDNDVLGKVSKKKDAGFFGKNDFFIPQNILSCEVEKNINKV